MKTLKKELTLLDVFVISTGAMFSSGFFLLPGIASAYTGPSVALAYLIAGVLVLPTMLSQAELATAMPRAGGTYYYLDRSLGPLAGTIGGLGTWLSLVFKSAFALIGVGAYLILLADLPIKPVAVSLTVLFTLLNVVGAKETTGLQRILVYVLLAVLAFFVVQGLTEIVRLGPAQVHSEQFVPFFAFGASGLVATVGMVFVSYAGLTKVASVAEEVQNPDRNIPLGMALSLGIVTLVYVVGVYIMVGVLEPNALREDLTPVATAAQAFFDWLPGEWGVWLVIAAAFAAFASTGNAGIMSASRYPLAMARDRLVWPGFARIGRFHTPDVAVMVTGAVTIFFIIVLSEEGVVKLASAFTLLIFGFVNAAVIVMRESKIPSYVPGYRSPWYPWTQVGGITVSVLLIPTMGLMPLLFCLFVVLGGTAWYFFYGRARTGRRGAIIHLFARIGHHRDEGLDTELRTILKERERPGEVLFQQVVSRASVMDLEGLVSYRDLAHDAAERLAERVPASTEEIEERLLEGRRSGSTPVSPGAALPHARLEGDFEPVLLLARSRAGVELPVTESDQRRSTNGSSDDSDTDDRPRHAVLFLVSSVDEPDQHLRLLANLARRIDEEGFMPEWLNAEGEQELREALLHHDYYYVLTVSGYGQSRTQLAGRALSELDLPETTLVALVRRDGGAIIPHGDFVLEEGDRMTVIGDQEGVRAFCHQFAPEPDEAVST
jgi:amino acid transporter/mannitol/fructose-specific phosphotransferase system IIA component (Ntr-type)